MIKPWGKFDSILKHSSIERWALLSCVNEEERSLSAARVFKILKIDLESYSSFIVRDERPMDPVKTGNEIQKNIDEITRSRFSKDQKFQTLNLLSDSDKIFEIAKRNAKKNLVLDITSMPKRFFGLLLKLLMNSEAVENLVVTYGLAEKYGEVLAANPMPWDTFPGFAPSLGEASEESLAIVGVGYMTLGLQELFDRQKPKKLHFLFPFPPGPPNWNRNWDFLSESYNVLNDAKGTVRVSRVHSMSCPEVFDVLCDITEGGRLDAVLAPFGPKPFSLAMFLFSIARERKYNSRSPIYYAQPRSYAPNYTEGVEREKGIPSVLAYPIKIGGQIIYSI